MDASPKLSPGGAARTNSKLSARFGLTFPRIMAPAAAAAVAVVTGVRKATPAARGSRAGDGG
eukprot:CAMPEP_0118852358 /NCGR_PEP_ID=MMETSP1163-20130328/1403_1 /TAXON_ID=124430 /ORGANISM="Phaeomonas parva, Strain CCMP2877" /LENGTH=61 /DNA_ID=CAMNT_0006784781 /DNA_START=483 /DNA_END=665 /DNA_ORIENTATION=+